MIAFSGLGGSIGAINLSIPHGTWNTRGCVVGRMTIVDTRVPGAKMTLAGPDFSAVRIPVVPVELVDMSKDDGSVSVTFTDGTTETKSDNTPFKFTVPVRIKTVLTGTNGKIDVVQDSAGVHVGRNGKTMVVFTTQTEVGAFT